MNQKAKRPGRTAGGPCLCQGIGPALSELLHKLGPAGDARRHFETARIEFLKGLRAVLDARIEQCSKRTAKGEKIKVE